MIIWLCVVNGGRVVTPPFLTINSQVYFLSNVRIWIVCTRPAHQTCMTCMLLSLEVLALILIYSYCTHTIVTYKCIQACLEMFSYGGLENIISYRSRSKPWMLLWSTFIVPLPFNNFLNTHLHVVCIDDHISMTVPNIVNKLCSTSFNWNMIWWIQRGQFQQYY